MKKLNFAVATLALYAPLSLIAGMDTTIVEVQFNPGGGEISPLLGQTVTVEGIVTSSFQADDLGILHIQQPNEAQWAGIELKFSIDVADELSELLIGDQVIVTGVVAESRSKTVLESISELEVIGAGSIEPTVLDPNLFSNPDNTVTEPYESMLVKLAVPEATISVVEQNADGFNNFGEWRVGSDSMSPSEGCRILTGRVTSQVVSSLNVSWVNSEIWETNSGRMNVPAIVVMEGDEFDSIVGIITDNFDIKLLPRINADVTTAVIFESDFEAANMMTR